MGRKRLESPFEASIEVRPSPEQRSAPPTPTTPPPEPAVPSEGGRRAFSGVTRTLTADELAEPGTLKVILELLQDAETNAEERKIEARAIQAELKLAQQQFHKADKEAAILEKELAHAGRSEIFVAICLTLGGTIIGLSPSLAESKVPWWAAAGVGLGLIIGVWFTRKR